ncbi:hypothetical protein QLQ15_04220 [Lysobacter sp. LF1]|uniref:DUF4234 domain-containing protein n=1 Tax=Lysobacter stagni TaxID=3045172 RepID=A0ABT6XDV6_9GAMM|nr:hypothetical protein [Lysobacter sp. LF1]MDI9238113.1 hypothetical protein [Lysobacter sp. LF1]
MSENLYAPPAAAVADAADEAATGTEFFVVGTTKLVLLYLATFGLYPVFWFYMHWARYKRFRRQDMWPAARALFAIFFTHELAGEIDERLHRSGIRYAWSPSLTATAFVVLTIVSTIASRVPEGVSRIADLLPVILLAPIAWTMVNMQRAANAACGQPDGASNRRLTWANWLWLVAGGFLWTMVLIGTFLPVP